MGFLKFKFTGTDEETNEFRASLHVLWRLGGGVLLIRPAWRGVITEGWSSIPGCLQVSSGGQVKSFLVLLELKSGKDRIFTEIEGSIGSNTSYKVKYLDIPDGKI